MSQIQLDRNDIQKALDWAFTTKKLPNKCILKGDDKNLRFELQDIDIGFLIPNFNVDLSVWITLEGQELVIKFQGENAMGKFGGVLVWLAEKTGIKRQGEIYKIESGDTIRIYLGKIKLGDKGKLGDLVQFSKVAWANNRLELDFKTR